MTVAVQRTLSGDMGARLVFVAELLRTGEKPDTDKQPLTQQERETLRHIAHMLAQAMAATAQSMDAQIGLIGLTKSVNVLALSLSRYTAEKSLSTQAKEIRENARDVQQQIKTVRETAGSNPLLRQVLTSSLQRLDQMLPEPNTQGNRVVRLVTLRNNKAITSTLDVKASTGEKIVAATVAPLGVKASDGVATPILAAQGNITTTASTPPAGITQAKAAPVDAVIPEGKAPATEQRIGKESQTANVVATQNLESITSIDGKATFSADNKGVEVLAKTGDQQRTQADKLTPPIDRQPEPPPAPPIDRQPEPPPAPPIDRQPELPPAPPIDRQPEPPPAPPIDRLPEPPPAPPIDRQPEPPPAPPIDRQPEPPPAPPIDRQPEPPPAPPIDRQPEPPPAPPIDRQPEPPPAPPIDRQPELPPAPPIDRQPEPPPAPPIDRLPEPPPAPPIDRQPELPPAPPIDRQPEPPPAPPIDRQPELPPAPPIDRQPEPPPTPPIDRLPEPPPAPPIEPDFKKCKGICLCGTKVEQPEPPPPPPPIEPDFKKCKGICLCGTKDGDEAKADISAAVQSPEVQPAEQKSVVKRARFVPRTSSSEPLNAA